MSMRERETGKERHKTNCQRGQKQNRNQEVREKKREREEKQKNEKKRWFFQRV